MSLMGSLSSGVSAMKSFIKGMNVIGNNIANVNTPGFNRSRLNYSDNFVQTLRDASAGGADGRSNRAPVQVGSGVGVSATQKIFTQGGVDVTGQPTDLAITGDGFFRVSDPTNNRQFLTRNGSFRVDNEGFLTDRNGFYLMGLTGGTPNEDPNTVGRLQIGIDELLDPEDEEPPPAIQSWSFRRDGRLELALDNGALFTRGQILLQQVIDPGALTDNGRGLYSGIGAAGPVGRATWNEGDVLTESELTRHVPDQGSMGFLEANALEGSNVDLVDEFSNMISTQRAFQAGSRIITVSDEMLQDIINLKR